MRSRIRVHHIGVHGFPLARALNCIHLLDGIVQLLVDHRTVRLLKLVELLSLGLGFRRHHCIRLPLELGLNLLLHFLVLHVDALLLQLLIDHALHLDDALERFLVGLHEAAGLGTLLGCHLNLLLDLLFLLLVSVLLVHGPLNLVNGSRRILLHSLYLLLRRHLHDLVDLRESRLHLRLQLDHLGQLVL